MVWMLDTPEQTIWLYGADWMNKDKKQPALNERGERLAQWMNTGSQISSAEIELKVAEYKQILSDDPVYLKALIDRMMEDLDIMVEVMDLNDMVFKEFQAQEHYRQTIRAGLLHLVTKLRDFCHQDLSMVHSPQTPAQQYQHGRKTGRYEAFAMAAQYIQDVIDQAAINVAKDKQKEEEGKDSDGLETNGGKTSTDTDVSDGGTVVAGSVQGSKQSNEDTDATVCE
jgi:hypothetical protein